MWEWAYGTTVAEQRVIVKWTLKTMQALSLLFFADSSFSAALPTGSNMKAGNDEEAKM